MNNILQGKNCVITGASGSLGTQIAIEFAKNRCNLFLIVKNKKKLKMLEDVFLPYENQVDIYYESADLRKHTEIKKIIKKIRNKIKSVDIIVNCAGIFPVNHLINSSVKEFDDCFNINIRAPFMFSREFAKDMIKNKWGRIVNIGSSSSYEGFEKTSIYCATKHALLGFSRSIQKELKKYNIRTYCISPGSMKSRIGKRVKWQNYKTFIEPKEVAKFISFLISFDKEMISQEVRLNRLKTD